MGQKGRIENGGAEKAELRIEGQGCFLASLLRRLRFLLLQERIEGKRKRLVQTNRSLRNVVTRGDCECHAKLGRIIKMSRSDTAKV